MLGKVILPYTGATARTNSIQLSDTLQTIIQKLLSPQILIGIDYCRKTIQRRQGEKTEDYYKRVDREIRLSIRSKLGLNEGEMVGYTRLKHGREYIFFFLNNSPVPVSDLAKTLESLGCNMFKVVERLLELRLKQALIETVLQDYKIDPVWYNSELYIAAVEQKPFSKKPGKLEVLLSLLRYTIAAATLPELILKFHLI